MKRDQNNDRQGTRFLRTCATPALLLVALLAGCGGTGVGDQNNGSIVAAASSTVPSTVPTPALFVFFDSNGDGVGDSVARIDLSTGAVMKTNFIGVSGNGGTHKRFYNGPIWFGSGQLVWGIDPDTLELVPGTSTSIQGNREGTVDPLEDVVAPAVSTTQAQQLSQSLSRTLAAQQSNASLSQYFNRTSFTVAEAQVIDLCAVRDSMSGVDTMLSTDAAAKVLAAKPIQLAAASSQPLPFNDMGYTGVGIEPSPDGKLTMIADRLGDHSVFLDTDPGSPTFGLPVRMVYPYLGVVKDQNSNVLARYAGVFKPAGGTAPGKTNYNRVSSGTSETDKNTYTEPCDSTALRNAAGQDWSWWPDVNGDAITGTNLDSIATASPQVVEVPVPVISRSTAPTSAGGIGSAAFTSTGQRTGPWMASLSNHNVGNEFYMSVENEGDNSESIWDVTASANVFEVERIVTNLKYVLTTDIGAAPFVNGTTYAVTVSYASTGGATTNVNYKYVSLAGDALSGVSANVTAAYLKKVNATDPGPNFILNGLNGRAFTSEGNIARETGSGTTNMIAFSDQIWLITQVGADGFQIVDLSGLGAPYLISHTINLPSSSTGIFSPDGTKFFQIRAGGVDVINTQTYALEAQIELPGPATGMAYGNYDAQPPSTTTSSTTTSSTTTPSSGGGAAPVNPCGG